MSLCGTIYPVVAVCGTEISADRAVRKSLDPVRFGFWVNLGKYQGILSSMPAPAVQANKPNSTTLRP
jgi:hypothetical protein